MDFAKGDLILDGAGRLVLTGDGYHAWVQWCVKTLLTERYAFMAYRRRYGMEMEKVYRQRSRASTELALRSAITEALTTDKRTGAVGSVEFEWVTGDSLDVTIVVSPRIGSAKRITVRISTDPVGSR